MFLGLSVVYDTNNPKVEMADGSKDGRLCSPFSSVSEDETATETQLADVSAHSADCISPATSEMDMEYLNLDSTRNQLQTSPLPPSYGSLIQKIIDDPPPSYVFITCGSFTPLEGLVSLFLKCRHVVCIWRAKKDKTTLYYIFNAV